MPRVIVAATKRVLCHPIGVEYDLVDRACVKFFELSRRLYVDASFPSPLLLPIPRPHSRHDPRNHQRPGELQ